MTTVEFRTYIYIVSANDPDHEIHTPVRVEATGKVFSDSLGVPGSGFLDAELESLSVYTEQGDEITDAVRCRQDIAKKLVELAEEKLIETRFQY